MPTKQVTVRLPKEWVEAFENPNKGGKGVSAEIQERIFRTIEIDDVEPNFRKLTAQLEQLARRVRRHYGADWFADRDAHATFLDCARRLFGDLPAPSKKLSASKSPPELVGEVIYNDYVAGVRDAERRLSEGNDHEA
jgi:hypothetical protein